MNARRPRLLTIGHGDLTIPEFMEMLHRSGVRILADIRSNPASVRYPWFERHALKRALEENRISYRWFRGLGGRQPSSPLGAEHVALTGKDRDYAAAMNTLDFTEQSEELLGLATSAVVVALCTPRDPAECHRRFLADKIMSLGGRVVHILGLDEAVEHTPHPDLDMEDDHLIYRGRQLSLI